jgi:nicotinate-nucleotide--dimethylbenzimidazole phosphoribosyltransferase
VITLVLGGTRSGKSEVAEAIAARSAAPVTYVATHVLAAADGGGAAGPGAAPADADMAARVAAHRARRPDAWATVEAGPDLPAVVAGLGGTVLVDSLGTWVAAVPGLAPDAAALCDALRARERAGAGDTVVVSEEVGLGVHPPTEVGRRFADALGALNRAVAAVADRALLVVAGRALRLDPVDDLA